MSSILQRFKKAGTSSNANCTRLFGSRMKRPSRTVIQTLLDFYRIPEELFSGVSAKPDSAGGGTGFFRFGTDNICYGRNSAGVALSVAGSRQFDASKDVRR